MRSESVVGSVGMRNTTMTRLTAGRYTPIMRYLIAVLALIPTLALADIAGPAKVIDGDTVDQICLPVQLSNIRICAWPPITPALGGGPTLH